MLCRDLRPPLAIRRAAALGLLWGVLAMALPAAPPITVGGRVETTARVNVRRHPTMAEPPITVRKTGSAGTAAPAEVRHQAITDA